MKAIYYGFGEELKFSVQPTKTFFPHLIVPFYIQTDPAMGTEPGKI